MTIEFQEKVNGSGEPIKIGRSFKINTEKAKQAKHGTKSIYVRIGFKNKTPFISQRGNGVGGSGDLISLNIISDAVLQINSSLYERLVIWSDKNNL